MTQNTPKPADAAVPAKAEALPATTTTFGKLVSEEVDAQLKAKQSAEDEKAVADSKEATLKTQMANAKAAAEAREAKDEGKAPEKVAVNDKLSTVPDGVPTDKSLAAGWTDQHQNNEGTSDVGNPGVRAVPKTRDQHIRNTKEAGARARSHGQEPNLSDAEANAGYRYVEPAFPPSDSDLK